MRVCRICKEEIHECECLVEVLAQPPQPIMLNPPPLFIPSFITRDFVKRHLEDYIFLYSAPVNLHKSIGQMAEILTVNCWPVPVREKMCKSSGFWSDANYRENVETIDQWLNDVPKIKYVPIIPFPNIGDGGSRLKEFAPMTHRYLKEAIAKIAYGNIVYVKESQPLVNVGDLTKV